MMTASAGDPAPTTTIAPAARFAELDDVADLEDVADRAVEASGIEGLDVAAMRSLIEEVCRTTGTGSAVQRIAAGVAREAEDEAETRRLVEAVGGAAEETCPEQAVESPDLMNSIYGAAMAHNTTTTEPTTTTTAPTTTTAAPTTVPPPPPTTAPPVTAPPTTAPARSTYYANCTAARNAGAAPVYRGDPGYGSHLDRDNDGVGCE